MKTYIQYLVASICFVFITYSSAFNQEPVSKLSESSAAELANAEMQALLEAQTPKVSEEDIDCVAKTVYFEARGEGRKGMAAVAHVIKNRTNDERFPSTVCGVVKDGKHVDGKPVRNRCQFSWYCSGTKNVIKDMKIFAVAREIAREVLLGKEANPIGHSLFFHAVHVEPDWKRYKFKVKLGNHLFYA